MRIPRKVAEASQFAEGFHRAILVDVEEHQSKSGSDSVRLTFRNGSYEHKEDLWTSPKAMARMNGIVKRLGIMPDGDDDDPEINFDDARGREFVIHIKHERTQDERIQSRIDYMGIWPLSHRDKKVVEFLETAYGKIPATAEGFEAAGGGSGSAGAGTGSGSNAAQDFSDI